MSYEIQNNALGYFSPSGTAALGLITVSGAGASLGEFVCQRQCDVMRLQFTVTTAVVGTTTAPTIVFSKRPTAGSATGAAVIGVLTIPTGTAAGTVIYKDIAVGGVQPNVANLQVGQSVEIAWTQAVGSPAGVGLAAFVCSEDPEVPANNAKMLASV